MEVCQVPPINFRFNQASPLRRATVRCNLFPNAKNSSELLIDDQMFILGMGFVGKSFAADLKAKGWVVSGSCTSVGKKKTLEELGYQAYLFDANDPQREILEIVKNHTHLVISIPTLWGLGDPMLRHKRLLENVLKDGKLRWLAYLSSTSVYGDCGGAWVDEDYPVKPTSEVPRARLAAEEEWLSLGNNLGIAAHVFRLGGIYGPGRSAIDTILKQEPLSKGQRTRLSKSYTSRVHVADICQSLNASISKPSSGKIYNVVDDDPAPREEVFELAEKLVEQKFPSRRKNYISSERSELLLPEKSSRGEKRVSNARLKNELASDSFLPHNSTEFSIFLCDEKRACIKWVERYFKDCLCNTKDELSFGFGVISLVFWGVAEIPQIVTNFRTKSPHGVSLLFLSAWIVGDVFNLVGCLLEPATLPTQFYTALLYTTSTVILVLQSLYYVYFPKGTSTQENEKHQEVEEVKKPLIQQKRSDSSVPIAEVCYNMSTVDNNESSFDDEANRTLAKKYVSRSRPIPRTLLAALLALSIRKPRLTLASMQVYVGSDGLKLIQKNGEESAYGEWLGWMMAAIYICGSLPQIWLNVRRGNVEGLIPVMFIFTLAANATYVGSILVRSIAWDEIKSNMPWLLDAVGCVVLDLFVSFSTLFIYSLSWKLFNLRISCMMKVLL